MIANAPDVRAFVGAIEESSVSDRSRSPTAGRRSDPSLTSSFRLKTPHSDPTDPQVPTAKRRRHATSRRSLILVVFVMIAMSAVGIVLLFQVGKSASRLPDARKSVHGSAFAPANGSPAH